MPLIFRDSFETILAKAGEYMEVEELDIVRRAYEFTSESIKKYKFLRFSGDPAIVHPVAVAEQLVDWRLDAQTVAAGFLHDTIEDPNIHPLQLRATFDELVTSLVDGVTKLKKFEIPEDTDADTAYYYKVFLAVAEDIRVALIKIADRLHNMRTIQYLPGYKRIKKCRETRRIFIPLTSFLGMDSVREELEDLTFEFLEPEEYEETLVFIESILEEEDRFFDDVADRINRELAVLKIPRHAKKFTYCISETRRLMKKEGPAFPRTGLIEVTVPDEESCYRALQAVHRCFQNLSNGFQDTIPFPSIDLKRMLETNVLHPSGRPFTVRIVSSEMKKVNRWGVVPYLAAPNEIKRTDFLMERVSEIGDIVERMRQDRHSPKHESLVEIITSDLLQKNIFVITSDGKRIELPKGSTVLDFAYKMGRDTGNNFLRAYLNSKEAGMGDIPESCDLLGVEEGVGVCQDVTWLSHANTPSARMIIRQQLAMQSEGEAEGAGREALLVEFRTAGLTSTGGLEEMENLLAPVVEFLQLPSLEAFYRKVGYGEIMLDDAMQAMREQYKRMAMISSAELMPVISSSMVFSRPLSQNTIKTERSGRGGIYVCEACTPVPGDIIEVSIYSKRTILHRKNCRKAARGFGRAKTVSAAWNDVKDAVFPARIKIKVFPGENSYNNILSQIESHGARLISSERNMRSPDGLELMEFLLHVSNVSTLNNICSSILELKDTVVATRI